MGNFNGTLGMLIKKAANGSSDDVDYIMSLLTSESDFATTRFVDFALSKVKREKGIERIKHFLFNGSKIQRNYASLYLNRNGDFSPVIDAYKRGLIDEIQAFAR